MVTPRFRNLRQSIANHSTLAYVGGLAGLTLFAAIIRAVGLGAKSLWYDEAVLYWIARTPISALIAANAQGNSAPPLYAFLVHMVSGISSSEAALRSVSWLAGSLAIPLFYQLSVRYVSRAAAFASALLVAVAPVFVEYSQQLREYSLTFLFSTLMLLGYHRYREGPSWKNLGLVVGAFCIGICLQYGLALLIMALNLAFLVEVLWMRRNTRSAAMWASGQSVVLVAAAAVWSSSLRQQFSTGAFEYLVRGYFEGPLASVPSFLLRQTYEMVLFAFPDPPLVILLIATGILAAFIGDGSPANLSHLGVPFLVAATAGLFSLYPYVGARQSIYLFPIIYVLAALGFDYVLRVDRRGILAVLLVLLTGRAALLPTLGYLRSPGDENLKPLVQQLNGDLAPGDRVFVCYGAIPAFRYYYTGDPSQVVEGATTEAWQEQFALSTSPRVWFVASHCGDVSTYLDFANQRRSLREVASAANAWLYVSP